MKGFVHNVASLAGGGIVAQAISLLAVPVLTRLYDASEFGVFSAYASLVLILVPVSTLRFNSALMIAETERRARVLLILSMLSVLLVSMTIGLIVTIFYLAGWTGLLGNFLLVLPFSIFMLGAVQSLQFWVLRLKQFNVVAVAQISESVVDRGISIGVGYFWEASAGGLIAGRILGPAINALFLVRKAGRVSSWKNFLRIGPAFVRKVAYRYRAFPLFSSWAFLANSAAREAPVLILAAIFGPITAGLYGLGLRVLNMPMLMVGDALAKVTLSRVREKRDNIYDLKKFMLRLYGAVLYFVIPVMTVLVTSGRDIFQWVFGKEWGEAGAYAAIMTPMIVLMLLYRISSALLDLFERQKQRLCIDIVLLIARIFSISIIGLVGGSVYDCLLGMVFATSLVYVGGIIYIFSLVKATTLELAKRTLYSMTFMLPVLSGCVILYVLQLTEVWALISSVVLIILQAVFVFIFDKDFYAWHGIALMKGR